MPSEEAVFTLHKSVLAGDLAAVTGLLDKGVDLNARSPDRNRYTALHWAAQEGHEQIVELLLQRGANPDLRSSRATKQATPLSICAARNEIAVARLLLHSGANPNIANGYGWTPLHNACDYGHVDMVKLLLAHGADIEARNERQRTPLHCAVFQNREAVVEVLVQQGADLNARALFQRSPLGFAVGRWGPTSPLAKLLKEQGATRGATPRTVLLALRDLCVAGGKLCLVVLLFAWPLIVWRGRLANRHPVLHVLVAMYAIGITLFAMRRLI